MRTLINATKGIEVLLLYTPFMIIKYQISVYDVPITSMEGIGWPTKY